MTKKVENCQKVKKLKIVKKKSKSWKLSKKVENCQKSRKSSKKLKIIKKLKIVKKVENCQTKKKWKIVKKKGRVGESVGGFPIAQVLTLTLSISRP